MLLLVTNIFAQATIETNANLILDHCNHLDKQIKVLSIEPDGHIEYVRAINTIGPDPIWFYIENHPEEFKPEKMKWITKLFHHGDFISYRQESIPSLHLTIHGEEIKNPVWGIDIDKCRPALSKPICLLHHTFFEVLPHLIFHSATSQKEIESLIKKKYEIYGSLRYRFFHP